jgi:hypothetical protein
MKSVILFPASRCDFDENGVLNLREPPSSCLLRACLLHALHLGCIEVTVLKYLLGFKRSEWIMAVGINF